MTPSFEKWKRPFDPSQIHRASVILVRVCSIIVFIAFFVLGLRAVLRLEHYWDSFLYHIPFAAERAGLRVPYDMSDEFRTWYEGFPPLAELAQGLLWRLTGSLNATGAAGYIAFVGFIFYCHRYLKASAWLVGMIALTAPLVIIHSATNYIDLFGNSFLATGFISCVSLALFSGRNPRVLLVTGLLGLGAAMWTKFLLVPPSGLGFLYFFALLFFRERPVFKTRVRDFGILFFAAALASIPYLLNWVHYDNPFWPVRIPLVGAWFPYMIDGETLGATNNRPDHMLTSSKLALFLHSLFEIHHPTSYDYRPRWLIDQGSTPFTLPYAFRMGGLWSIGVVTFLGTAIGMLISLRGRKGALIGVSMIAVLLIVSQIPQSHELRYYLFIPLCWAAIIAILFPTFQAARPRTAMALITAFFGMFIYMAWENRAHYAVEVRTYLDIAKAQQMEGWWEKMHATESYCAIGMIPSAIMLTGPRLREFTVYDRTNSSLCPKGSIVMRFDGILPLKGEATLAHHTPQEFNNRAIVLFGKQEYWAAIKLTKRSVELDPENADTRNNLCFMYGHVNRWRPAVEECERALAIRPTFDLARNNLIWAKGHLDKENQ